MTSLFYSLTADILRLDLSRMNNSGEYDLEYQGEQINSSEACCGGFDT